jgi:heptosyltransferase-1
MGDVLHALPAVTAVRSALPHCHIGWAIEPQWTALLQASSVDTDTPRGPQMPVVDLLHIVPAKRWARRPLAPATLREIRATRKELRAERYDLCIDLQGAVRSAWIARMAGATRLVGEAQPREPLARWLFPERILTTGVHVIEQAREVVSAALQPTMERALPRCAAQLPVDPAAERWCSTWLAERGITRFAVVNPGAGWGAKRWPVERYADVARQLHEIGIAAVVNAGPGEGPLAEAVRGDSNTNAHVIAGSLGQLTALLRRACLFIGGDTGPLHLAAALAVPVVGIYGPTDPARNGPYETNARVLRNAASVRDHARRAEPEAGLLTISVEDVMAAVHELLDFSVDRSPINGATSS